jgi:sporulation protein YlmC with PRC-barrel domain
MDTMKHRRLQELDGSDFEIVEGEPDIRGWDVKNSTGQKIGEVEELIVDAQQKKVRYMVVDLDDNELKLDHRKVLIPIGMAELHKEEDDVLLPSVQAEHLGSLPAYDKNSLTPETERRICSVLGRTDVTTHSINREEHHLQFYRHEYFNDDNLYKHRLHEAQSVEKQDSEYEKGLHLWEKRSEGGIIPNDTDRSDNYSKKEQEEEARMEMVRNRRNNYEQRRGGSDRDQYRKRDNSVEGRIRDEGLQDA